MRSGKTPPPVNPVKELISVLQKQLLEPQKNQNDTRRIVDEQSTIVQVLSTEVKTLEKQRTAPPPAPQIISKPTTTPQTTPEKKLAKDRQRKNKKTRSETPAVRRQVP